MLYDDLVPKGEYLCHHGIKGQRWGIRHDKEKKGFHLFKNKNSNDLVDIEGLLWSISKLYKGDLYTAEKDVDITMPKRLKDDQKTRQSLKSLLKNYDTIKTISSKAHKNYISKLPKDVDLGPGSLTNFRVAGPSIVADYMHDYGAVSIEMDPSNGRVLHTWMDD